MGIERHEEPAERDLQRLLGRTDITPFSSCVYLYSGILGKVRVLDKSIIDESVEMLRLDYSLCTETQLGRLNR